MDTIATRISSEIEHLSSGFTELNLTDNKEKIQKIKLYIQSQDTIPITMIDEHLLTFVSYLSANEEVKSSDISLQVYQDNMKNQPDKEKIGLVIAFKQSIYEIFCTPKKEYSDLRNKMKGSEQSVVVVLAIELSKNFQVDYSIIIGLIMSYFMFARKLGALTLCKFLGE